MTLNRKEKADIIAKLQESIFQNYVGNISTTKEDKQVLLNRIVEEKISKLESNSLPDECYQILEEMKSLLSNDSKIFVRYFQMFPSYSITIQFSDKLENNIKSISWLNLKISLLSGYFTIFFEEWNSFLSFSEYEKLYNPVSFRILSSRNSSIDPEKKLFEELKRIVVNCFSNYIFIPHKILFDSKINCGIPYGLVTNESIELYTFYNYLFDSDLSILRDTKIVE